jgi:FkbM family methyltransferase
MTSLRDITDCPRFWQKLEGASGQRIFDIGANGGGTARLFAPNFAEVVAFEPAVESYDDLVASAAPNVVPLNLAVSDHTGIVELREADQALAAGQLVSEGPLNWGETIGHRECLCITLDEAAKTYGQPDAIKIDTEGHEMHVLAGATQTIDAHCAEWFIEVHSAEFLRPIQETFSGYRTQLLRHSGYPVDSDGWLNHLYVVAV